MNCPVCGGRTIGKVGVSQFYCWDCCVEFATQDDKVVIYDLAEDGTLVAWEETPFPPEAMPEPAVMPAAVE